MLAVEEVEMGNLLTWSTKAEQDNQTFVIQKSFDGENFETHSIMSGAGTTITLKNYRFLDMSLAGEKVYYRLIDMDVKGHFAIGAAVKLERQIDNHLKVLSMDNRSVQDYYTLTVMTDMTSEVRYEMLDGADQVVRQGIAPLIEGTNALGLDLSELTGSAYRLALQAGEEREEVIIERVSEGGQPSNFALKKED